MERRWAGAPDEGAHRCAHRPMLPARDDSVDPFRMDVLTRSLFVLRVDRSCGRPFPLNIPTIRLQSPYIAAVARSATSRAASTVSVAFARPTAGRRQPR